MQPLVAGTEPGPLRLFGQVLGKTLPSTGGSGKLKAVALSTFSFVFLPHFYAQSRLRELSYRLRLFISWTAPSSTCFELHTAVSCVSGAYVGLSSCSGTPWKSEGFSLFTFSFFLSLCNEDNYFKNLITILTDKIHMHGIRPVPIVLLEC